MSNQADIHEQHASSDDELSSLPGLDLAKLRSWFATAVPGLVDGNLSATLVAGGRSNLTYRVTDGDQVWIVRRPPLGHVLATAHDMSREFRVMSALQDTAVPVPRMIALCKDLDVMGAPFYVMEMVDGHPYRHYDELAAIGPDRTQMISTRLVDVLATLHTLDPSSLGLDDFGRPAGFALRQVHRWKRQLEASFSRDLPAADELHNRLVKTVPATSPVSIVHGDYRLDNILIDDEDQPRAVIDWEMATVGDPLTDLALLVIYRRWSEITNSGEHAEATSAPGFLSADELVERYALASARDLSGFDFYLGLAAYKLAAVLEGIHYRHLHGHTVGAGFQHIGSAVTPLLETGLDLLRRDN